MKAVVLHPKGKFKIEEIAQPQPKSHQLLLKVEGFGLNFADVMARKGLYREAPPLPSVLGYDVVGEVVAQGADVPENLMGKRMVAMTRFGGYAEYAATDYRAASEIPEDYPLAEALALATQYCTAHFCLFEKGSVFKGDNILIHAAAGGVGVALTQLAKLKACKIFGTCGSNEKVKFIQKMGVDVAINYREVDYEKAIKERMQASFNAIAGSTIKKDMRLLGAGGTLVCFGAASRTDKTAGIFSNLSLLFSSGFYHPLFLMMRSKTLVGVNMLKIGDYRPNLIQSTLKEVVDLAVSGKIAPHAGGLFKANQIDEAHQLLENRKSMGKIAVSW